MLRIFREWVEMLIERGFPFLPVKVPGAGEGEDCEAGDKSPAEEEKIL
jgi:hypothetical protein